jgi:hypothetical protein
VQPGDTLWSIANKYLEHPWDWKMLWHSNPRIQNPNRLYVGAVLEVRFHQGEPYFRVHSNGTIKLSPHARPSSLGQTVLPIPLMDIKPFLNASLVMNKDLLTNAPYIVAFMGEHLLGGQGDEVYVKKLHPSPIMPEGATISYAVYRANCPLIKPVTQEVLGYKATLVGYGELVRGGDPAVMLLTSITEGVKLTDKVLLNDFPDFNLYFEPKAPLYPIDATIIDLPPAYTQGAVGLVAIIDQGQNSGLEAGDVLGIYSPPHRVQDPLQRKKIVIIPRERIGEMMVFRTFSKTSLALVVRSIRAIHLGDIISKP